MSRCQNSVIDRRESSTFTTHFFAATLVSFWLSICQANAQSRETAFGQTHAMIVPGRFDRFALCSRPSLPPALFFWTERGSQLGSAVIDSSGRLVEWRSGTLLAPLDDFQVIEFKPERKVVGVAVDRQRRMLSLYDHLESDTLRASATVILPLSPEHVVFGDLNGDGRTDFLACEKENPGIVPFFGLGNGKFRKGKPFALDNAVGSLRLVHLNNDNIIDLVLYDWVRSEVHLLYGVGQGKFLDQAAIRVDAAVQQLEATSLSRQGAVDLVLSCANPAKVFVLGGNGMGDFKLHSQISLKEPMTVFYTVDVNGDGYKDIVSVDRASMLRAYLNSGDGTFEDRLDFGGRRGPAELCLVPSRDSGAVDAVLFDKETQRLEWLAHAELPAQLVDSLDFATGARPRGVAIADVNGDRLDDVLVATAGSSSLSVYFNREAEGLIGQAAFGLPASAHDLAFHSVKDSVARFLVSYPESKQLSLFTLDQKDWSTTNATISTDRAVEFIYWNNGRVPGVEFFCFAPSVAATPASLTLFQEMGTQQFIERSFVLSPTNTLLGAGVGSLNRDPFPDVAFVYKNNMSGKFSLAYSLGDSLSSFRHRIDIAELPEKNLSRSYVWLADLAGDGRQDIVMLNDGPGSVLVRVRHLRDAFFTPIDTIATGVQISDWAQIQFSDLDKDGTMDVVINDISRGELGWFKGHGKSFDEFRPLCSIPRRSNIALGDLNHDGVPDIAVTFGDQGFVRLYDGRILVRRSNETAR
jgi:hypothetical protein